MSTFEDDSGDGSSVTEPTDRRDAFRERDELEAAVDVLAQLPPRLRRIVFLRATGHRYVGATLPLLFALRAVHVSASDALTSQDVAEPIVAPLVGVIALLVSVSLTTGLAAARRPHPGRRAP